RAGVLRLYEQLHRLDAGWGGIESYVKELIDQHLFTFKKLYLNDESIKNLIIVDDYISPWVLRGGIKTKKDEMFEIGALKKLIKMLVTNDKPKAAQILGISEEKIPLMLISAVMIKRISEVTGADNIWAPGVTLGDGIAYEYAESMGLLKDDHDFERDIIAGAYNTLRRYKESIKDSKALESMALNIFDATKRIHGLGKRERLLLRLAAILSKCGKYINMADEGVISSQIIMNTEIMGLSPGEHAVVANTVRLLYTEFVYGDGKETFDTLLVAKLSAILKMASVFCLNPDKTPEKLTIAKDTGVITFNVSILKDYAIESSIFKTNAVFFREVFGVSPVLKIRKPRLGGQ
ncbi:MAG: exopolyphosphatase, partial [Lachnospiraceae bacterium]|nr:exopolyphosphatase [Lachnospiraceae bacterium]